MELLSPLLALAHTLTALSLTHSHLEAWTDFITTDPRPGHFDAGILEPGDARRDIGRQSRAREQAIERPREGAMRWCMQQEKHR